MPLSPTPISPIRKVGFVGLGIMGLPMARNLARRGYQLVVFNRTPSRALLLTAAEPRARIAESPRALAEQVDAFCTCVANPAALREVTMGDAGLLEGARRGQLFVEFSTVSPELGRELGEAFGAREVDFVEAPVTGSKPGAEAGTLLAMVGATPAALERARPLLGAIGERVVHCGPVGAGAQVKLAANALIAGMLEGLAEGLLLTQRAGVSPEKLLEVIAGSGFRSPYYELKGRAMLGRAFETTFAIDLMFKDLSLFLESAARHRVPTPAAAAVREAFGAARALGHGSSDIAAVIRVLEALTGTSLAATPPGDLQN